VRRLVHDQPRCGDRILDVPHSGDCSCVERRAVHDGSGEFVSGIGVEDRATTGIEGGIVLEDRDSRLNCVDAASTGQDDVAAGLQGRGHRGLVRLDRLRGCDAFTQRRGAHVNRQDDVTG
jgi:hypothetical protein